MNINKRIIQKLAKICDEKILECSECGMLAPITEGPTHVIEAHDCKTCTPWRELRKELCFHEFERTKMHTSAFQNSPAKREWKCKHCDKSFYRETRLMPPKSPELTIAMHGDIPLIVHWMQVLGIWERWITDLGVETGVHTVNFTNEPVKMLQDFANKLVTGTPRLEDVIRFLERRV